MNLWIRSQDKSSIVKVDNLYVSVGNYICYYVEKGKEVPDTYYRPSGELGRYETKERALEVLDEIQNKISEYQMVDIGYHSEFICNNIVYEMPEE
jgi:hypothetical protein